MAEYRILKQQTGGKHYKPLSGVVQFSVGQSGNGTVDPSMDAYERDFVKSDIESYGIGMPNGLGLPTSALNALGATKRFVVFALPMVPYDTGSMTRLRNGEYSSAHRAIAKAAMAAGWGEEGRSAVRCGHEYNAQVGQQGHYNWATGHIDPLDGHAVTISDYFYGADLVEGIWRSEGYQGVFAWSLGTANTSALPPEQAMPTHGDPAKTALDWDIYFTPGWNMNKNDAGKTWTALKAQHERYLAFVRKNGLAGLAHSEWGHITTPASQYALNDLQQITHDFYEQLRNNAPDILWANHYIQQQYPNGVTAYLSESHALALSVPTAGGTPAGTGSTTRWTSNFPPGATALNQSGTNSPATIGNLNHSSSSGLHWVRNPDINVQDKTTAYLETFGGLGTTGGAAGLALPVAPPVIPTGQTHPSTRKVRRQFAVYR